MTAAPTVYPLHLRTNRVVEVTIDGEAVSVPEGATILQACEKARIDTPTLCYAETLTPVNACRVCVVEVEGSRALVPACSRKAEPGMVDPYRQRTGTSQPQAGPGAAGIIGGPVTGE